MVHGFLQNPHKNLLVELSIKLRLCKNEKDKEKGWWGGHTYTAETNSVHFLYSF